MEALKYKRTDVLAKLKENRDKHKLAYDEAEEGFKEEVVKELIEALRLAKSGKEYRLSLKQSKPVEHLKEYDRAIQMLDMSPQEHITLTEHEFSNFVQDNWGWSDHFSASAARYSKSPTVNR